MIARLAMGRPRAETEIKLFAPHPRCSPALLRTLAERRGVALDAGVERDQVDTYLDTAELRLGNAGLGLRLRRSDGRVALGLKSGARARAGVHRREELESAWHRDAPPRRTADLPPAFAARVEPYVHDRPLLPLVVLHNRRHAWQARLDGQDAELCLDRVTVRDPDGRDVARFDEVEIEVDGDAPAAGWLDFAAVLGADLGLEPATLDKLQRALGYGRTAQRPTPGVTPERSMRAAGRAAMAEQLQKLQQQECRARLDAPVDAVHKLRVACRRLRATLTTFADSFTLDELDVVRRFAKGTASAFGEVRDLDVLFAWLDEGHRSAADDPAARRVRRRLERRRARLATAAVASLSKPRRLARGAAVADLLTGVEPGPDFSPRVAEAAPERLREALTAVLEQAARIERRSPADDLHELRIRTKRLRYTAECFAPVYGSDLELFVDRATSVQDALGEFNDACVAAERLTAIALAGRFAPAELLVFGGWIERQRRRAARARKRFEATWTGFDGDDLRTALGAVLRGARPA